MRSLPANAIAEIAKKQGIKPTLFVDIQWAINGPWVRYSASIVPGADPRILNIGDIDDVIKVAGNETVAEVRIQLDDSDSALRAIINNNDIHFRSVRVYQWFHNLDISDAFLVFRGQINSPIDYNEGDKTLSFSALTRLEDVDAGFRPDDGTNFNWISDEYYDKDWPMAFGTVRNLPGVLVYKIAQGQTTHPLSMANTCPSSVIRGLYEANVEILNIRAQLSAKFAEGTLRSSRFGEERHTEEEKLNFYRSLARANSEAAAQANERIATVQQQIAQAQLEVQIDANDEPDFGTDVGHVINGRRMPQNQFVTIKINEAFFTGRFSGDTFFTESYENPNGECDETAFGASFIKTNYIIPYIDYDEDQKVSGFVVQPEYQLINLSEPKAENTYWFADAGATVEVVSDQRELYVVNVIRSTVHAVYARRGASGIETLQKVPTSYYTVKYYDLGNGLTATVVEMKRALSSYDEGWTNDDIYVDLTSDVGPNTANIIQWLIETFSSYSVDASSFASVAASLQNYPSHFALFNKRELFSLVADIAWQARCRIWLNNSDIFFISYLSAEPGSTSTIEAGDIEQGSLRLGHTPSENIVTKFRAEWFKDYSVDKPNVVTVQYNIAKYGVHEKTYQFFIYNIVDLVVKSAQFWAVRLGNTWKTVAFSCFLNKLEIETFDCVTFNLPGYFANTAVKGLVEEAEYNPDSNRIDMSLWLPVRAGTMTQYNFAWPANLSVSLTWPQPDEVFAALPKEADGTEFDLPQNIDNTQPTSGTGASFSSPTSLSDSADSEPASPISLNDQTDTVKAEDPPSPANTRTTRISIVPERVAYDPPEPKLSVIDIRSTRIIDSATDKSGRLSNILMIVDNPDSAGPDDPDHQLVVLWNFAQMADVNVSNVGPISFDWDDELEFFRPSASFWLDDPDQEASTWENDKAINDSNNVLEEE